MVATLMNRLRLYFRQIHNRLGDIGLWALVLMLAAGLATLYWLNPLGKQLQQIQDSHALVKLRLQDTARSGISETGGANELRRFYAHFAGSSRIEWLDKLYVAAKQHNLTLNQGEYRIAPSRTGKLMRYQITFPVAGSYAQIRQFLNQALRDVPIAALEDISFKRESIGATRLEARIKLVLFLQEEAQQ